MRKKWIHGEPKELNGEIAQLRVSLNGISKDLKAHVQFEEREFLPVFCEHAAVFLREGILCEHRKILESISEFSQHLEQSETESVSENELILHESRIRASLQKITLLIREHNQTAQAIITLSKESLGKEGCSH